MSDIVERAREYAHNLGGPPEDYLVWQLADEIERLQAALRSIITRYETAEEGWPMEDMVADARKALEEA